MPRRRRDAYTYWLNDKPIVDPFEALDLLKPRWADPFGNATRYISKRQLPAELHRRWFRDRDSGGASSGTHYLEIQPQVVEFLEEQGYVRPFPQEGWGFTHYDQERLILSPSGARELERYLEENKKEAEKLLTPGVHSKFSGLFEYIGYDRVFGSGHRGGELYFEFKTPMPEDGTLRVYPLRKEAWVEKINCAA